MRFALVVLSAFALAQGAVAQGQGEPAGLEAAKAALEEENRLLRRRVAELEQHIDELWSMLRDKKYTARVSVPFDGREQPSHLDGISLPDDPSDDDVRCYVVSVLCRVDRNCFRFDGVR